MTSPKDLRDAAELGIRAIGTPRVINGKETVADALRLEGLPTRFGFVDGKERLRRAKYLLESYGLAGIDPNLPLVEVSAGMQRLIEVVSVFSKTSKLLVLDNPTAPMNQREAEIFDQMLERQKVSGVGMVYLTASPDEALRIGDRITVIRDGSWISTRGPEDAFVSQLNGEMLGYDPNGLPATGPRSTGPESTLRVEGVTVGSALFSASFKVKRAEILGVVGIEGAGQSELVQAMAGAIPRQGGEIFLRGSATAAKNASIEHSLDSGLGFVPDLLNGNWPSKGAATAGFSLGLHGLNHSNPQRPILEMILKSNPVAIAMDNPTRGLSAGNRIEILRFLPCLAELGIAVVISSTYPQDMLLCCDRIAVMVNGAIKQIFDRREFNLERIEKLMRS